MAKLSTLWSSGDLEGKRILHKTLIPDGVFYNAAKHEYLTKM